MAGAASGGWRVGLLGGWRLHRSRVPVAVARRQRRLVAAIALRGSRSRTYLSQLLWPEVSSARATNNLRNTLWHITHELPGLVVAGPDLVDLRSDVVVDVHLAQRAAAEVLLAGSFSGVEMLLEQEPLLPDWYEDWVLDERDALRRLRVECLELLARRALAEPDLLAGRPGAARLTVRIATAACEAEPLSESLALLLIRAHVASGDVAVGLKTFEGFRTRLHEELLVQPSGELHTYVSDITRTLRSPGPRLRSVQG